MRGTAGDRLLAHVQRLGEEHPPISVETVDFSVVDAAGLERRFGHVLDYMARVELEVDRNVLELTTMLPDPPEVDVIFYRDVWQPQETQHGLILDTLQQRLGRPPATTDLDRVGPKLRVLGALSHLPAFQDVCRMLYYLTGMSTERSAVLAYNLLHDGLADTGEQAIASTVVAPIRRQEPGHYAFYQLSARQLWSELAGWQRFLVRVMRRLSYAPVGVNNDEQRADFGDVMATLGIDEESDFAAQVTRVEMQLLWARDRGLRVPPYVARAFHDALEASRARAA
ncbi:GTP-binding protein LepA [Nocardioides sp. CBS4Y-1]|uniref:GTP-binding protein LepA n=1 Tax=Nocardioides acrostichi TaxID=2784339 RepID=A0A930V468_9ACTN|nr:GTP-binding protein LepA [Nocardioides acrostichi]